MSLLSELDPQLTGLQQLHALIARGVQPTIHDTLDIALVSAEEGFVVVEARPSGKHLNPAGIVQGGYVAAVMDTACGCAVHSVLPPSTAFTTLELKVAYHRAVTTDTGVLRAEGRILSSGRRAAFSEAKVFDAAGKLIASATSSLLVMPLTPKG
ncbi:MAG: PaaI family thioesterase [Polyangiales bacterium]